MLKVRPATGQHSNSPHTIAFASVRGRSAGTWPTQGNQSTRSRALARSRSLSKESRLEKCKQVRQRSLTKAAQLILVFFLSIPSRVGLQLQLQLICMRHRSELWMRFRRGLQLKIGTRTKGVCAASVCVQCVCVWCLMQIFKPTNSFQINAHQHKYRDNRYKRDFHKFDKATRRTQAQNKRLRQQTCV